jgi:hypothetical protein
MADVAPTEFPKRVKQGPKVRQNACGVGTGWNALGKAPPVVPISVEKAQEFRPRVIRVGQIVQMYYADSISNQSIVGRDGAVWADIEPRIGVPT